jgi:putative endonuclease
MPCSVYIVKSEIADRYYIGSATDVDKRVAIHNSGSARWTRRYQPWVVVHIEEYATRGEAIIRERFLKRLKGIGRHLDEIRRGDV